MQINEFESADFKYSQVDQNKKNGEINERFSESDKLKLAKAAKGFESLLTSMLIKSMTSTTSGFFGEESMGGDFYNSIFESELADHISSGKGLGIAGIIYKKLTGENISPPPSPVQLNKDNIFIEKPLQLKIDPEIPSFSPSSKSLQRLNKYEDFIEEASNTYGIDKNIIKSVILAESAANEKAVSSQKAKGLMQLMDSTAEELGVKNVWDPKENILGGTKYLADLLRQYSGDIKLALAGYNAGPGNVEKFNGVPPFEETQNYVARVIGYFNHLSES
ncbi:MAG TPA: transglycosylase SLT domain-containing protein [Ignavibacteriaceae bacterium]|nr:transglycosylase SLT domain-containing protein [Ignavibacteriaceae bacterium]